MCFHPMRSVYHAASTQAAKQEWRFSFFVVLMHNHVSSAMIPNEENIWSLIIGYVSALVVSSELSALDTTRLRLLFIFTREINVRTATITKIKIRATTIILYSCNTVPLILTSDADDWGVSMAQCTTWHGLNKVGNKWLKQMEQVPN